LSTATRWAPILHSCVVSCSMLEKPHSELDLQLPVSLQTLHPHSLKCIWRELKSTIFPLAPLPSFSSFKVIWKQESLSWLVQTHSLLSRSLLIDERF
jgi:hypothetical protein